MSYGTSFMVCTEYSDECNYLTFTISDDNSVFGIYNVNGFGYINRPLDDSSNAFITAKINVNTPLNYECEPSDGHENDNLKINFEQIKYFIASDNGYGFVTNQKDNNIGLFLNETVVENELAYFNFLNYIGNNDVTEPINLFGKSNEKITTIVLMSHYLKDDQTITIWSNAFVNYPNLKNVFIYGDVNFENVYINDNYDLLHKNHNGIIDFYFITSISNIADSTKIVNWKSNYNKFIEEIKNICNTINSKNILFEKFMDKIVKLNGSINDTSFHGSLISKYGFKSNSTATIKVNI